MNSMLDCVMEAFNSDIFWFIDYSFSGGNVDASCTSASIGLSAPILLSSFTTVSDSAPVWVDDSLDAKNSKTSMTLGFWIALSW